MPLPNTNLEYIEKFRKCFEKEKIKSKNKKIDKAKFFKDYIAKNLTKDQLKEVDSENVNIKLESKNDAYIGLNNPKFDFHMAQISGSCKVQIARSASSWSIGFSENFVEQSIHNAYVTSIENSKHFIYVENQFFMSHHDSLDCNIKNKIVDSIFHRILRAHTSREKFKVYIILPLYPG